MNSCTFGGRGPFVPLAAPLSVFQKCLEQAQQRAGGEKQSRRSAPPQPRGLQLDKALTRRQGGTGEGWNWGLPH